MTPAEFAERLKARPSDSGWEARCPAHDDGRASLSIGKGEDGKVLLCCHAGCTPEEICSRMDLTVSDLFPPRNGGSRIVKEYDYRDEGGTLLFQVVRFEPKDFRQRCPNGAGGWNWKLNGTRRVLYRLPELLAADPAKPVFIGEGEKDADALIRKGEVATTNPGGAGKWRHEYSESLRGRHVIILPHNDDPGRKHAEEVAESLRGIAASVTILHLPGLPPKGDVCDWLAMPGNDVAKLLEMANGAKTIVDNVNNTSEATDDQHPTDLGNSRRILGRHGADLRFCYPLKQWFIYDGKHWAADDTAEAMRRAKDTQAEYWRWATAGLAAAKGEEARKRWLDRIQHALKWEKAKAMADCLELLKSEPGIPVMPSELDRPAMLLNTLDGTVDLTTGDLLPHRRDDLLTKLAPVHYDRFAECPLWCKFLERIFLRRPTLIHYLQRVIGYALTGDVREDALWFMFGSGCNGKSTFLATIQAMLGPYAIQAVSELLMERKHDAHPTERMDLFGRRFVCTIETDEGKRMAEALMKQLTGRDRVRARGMKKDFVEFEPTHKIFLAANHKPVIHGTDHGTWRRIKLIPFAETITDAEKDKALPEKLKAELPGILTWAIDGCLDWQKNGLQEPPEVTAATQAYRAEQDLLAGFIAECCVQNVEVRCKVSALLEKFQEWSGDKVTTPKGMTQKLRDRGYECKTGHGNATFCLGLGLPG